MSTAANFEFSESWSWTSSTTLNDGASGGAIDADGSLILVGSQGYTIEETGGDFVAVKLLSSGEILWEWTNSSQGDNFDSWLAVDTDSNNDVIIGGVTEGYWAESNPDKDIHIAVIKLDGSSGKELWRYQESPSGSSTLQGWVDIPGEAFVEGVAVDGDDNVFLVGQVIGSLQLGEGDPGDSDAFVMKLDGTDGSEVWRQQIGEGSEFDTFRGAKTDSAGDLVTVGHRGQEEEVDIVVLKLSGTDGSSLWDFSQPSATMDVLNSVDVDADGDVYVAGGVGRESIYDDAAEVPIVLKLDGSTGDVIWTYEGTAPSRAVFSSVGVDPVTGAIVGAGTTEGTWLDGAEQGGYDFAAVVLNGKTGGELSRYQGGAIDFDFLSFAGFDGQGGLLVGGRSTVNGEGDMVAIKFAANQDFEGIRTPAPTTTATSSPTEAAVKPEESQGSNDGLDWWEIGPLEGLAAWEVAAIAGGLLFLLLACTARCCYKKGTQAQANPTPPGQEAPRPQVPAPVATPSPHPTRPASNPDDEPWQPEIPAQ